MLILYAHAEISKILCEHYIIWCERGLHTAETEFEILAF